jgi:uncharacterized protein (TIGR00266 family)
MSDVFWFAYNDQFGREEGPFSENEMRQRIADGAVTAQTLVYSDTTANWEPAGRRPEFAALLQERRAAAAAAPPPPAPRGSTVAHEIDYEIQGTDSQFVEITLDPGEACVAEAGSFMYMDPGIEMRTIFGDGSGQDDTGFMGKLLSAGKRVLTGESLFMTVFSNRRGGRATVSFAAPYPGKILPLDLLQHGGTIICQKDAFLCAAQGISVGIALQKRLGVGFFGGEGFILQKLEGDGLAFVHAGGTLVSRRLERGETLRLDTGCLVAFEPTVSYDIQMVPGIKTALFGGEGLFFATLTGPGTVWVQSLPFSRLASRVYAAAPQTPGARKGEGSLLGGLGDLMMGDR